MNGRIADELRDPTCSLCRMSRSAERVCITGAGPDRAKVMVVGKMPNSGKYQTVIVDELRELGFDPSHVYFTQAVKCRSFEDDPSSGDVKTCARAYLDDELRIVRPRYVLALGNEALLALTGHSGITKYRGRPITKGGMTIVPTISPAVVFRNPGQRAAWLGDLRQFGNVVFDRSSNVPKMNMRVILTKADLKDFVRALKKADLSAYDIETTRGNEWDPDARIICLCTTLVTGDQIQTWALPLFHPQSPWRRSWRAIIQFLAQYLVKPKKQIAHNGKFDARWLRYFGVDGMTVTFDTMIAAHLLDENRQKGLKPQAVSRLGVAPWGVDTKNLLDMPMDEVLEYCGLDTYYMYHIYKDIRTELIAKPRLLRIFKHILMPANHDYIETERYGIWVDRERLTVRGVEARAKLADLDAQLAKFVPDPDDPEFPKDAKGKPATINWNASKFARWFWFEHLGLPVLARGKDKPDGSPGEPSMKEDLMKELRSLHPAVPIHLERVSWAKACSAFFDAYDEVMDLNGRIHTTFKITGTVTGRPSSGKVDEDKLSGRKPERGVNLQQVPRDAFIRGLFGAPSGRSFVEADFSQIELRVVAFISRDPTMLHLYQTDEDIHLATAAWILGKPRDQVTKDDRKKAKAVNFGFVYGMGWRKFIETAFVKYDLVFTEDEARAIRTAFFTLYDGLPDWHIRQRRLVHKYHRVESPLGRTRHLPDILSGDKGVKAEAERQAINSPVQGFASDMTLFSMVLINREFRKQGVDAHCLGTVHDAINFEIADDHLARALPIIKGTMENLPMKKKFGLTLDIPIVADLKVGSHWGDAREISEEEVYDWKGNAA